LSFKHKYTYDEKAKILLEYQAGVHGFRETRAISGGSIKTATRSSNLMAGNFVFFIVYLTGSSSALRQILQLFFYLFIQLFFYLLLYLFFCSVSSPT
jgi:hypothetical protein